MMKKISYIFLFLLLGCGLTPLHKLHNEDYTILTKVELGKVDGKKSYILRNYLEDQLDPNNLNESKEFVIDISLNSSTEAALVQKDSTISNSDMIVTAHFSIKRIKDNEKIKDGHIKVVTNYEENLSSFSSFSQKNKAYDNALKEIARSVKSYIIIALLNKNYITHENPS
jgi:hypothetical protein